MNFVDLAGSEKASIHSQEDRLKEGQHINKSLFFLTQVISMKSDKKK
jgi:kinesin family protein 4/21/27/centromeric protein E